MREAMEEYEGPEIPESQRMLLEEFFWNGPDRVPGKRKEGWETGPTCSNCDGCVGKPDRGTNGNPGKPWRNETAEARK